MNEAEETVKRIAQHKGVTGVIIVNAEGIPLYTNMDNSATNQYATNFTTLVQMARSSIRDIDPANNLTFLRVRSKKNEILVAPEKEFMLVVIQNPNE